VSETSFETGKISSELESIKELLSDLAPKKDLEQMRKSLIGREEIESLVTQIVQTLLTSFEDKVEKTHRQPQRGV
jgi:hypothetical protein